jgi:isoleucyl-tRNA synthetase
VKDWAISRSRYWGTPLPIWECAECGELKVVGGFAELEKESDNKKTPAKFIFIRHGEAENNTQGVMSCFPEKKAKNLTLKGRVQIEAAAKKLKKLKPAVIIHSDVLRTVQSAEIIKKILGVPAISDERIREMNFGDFNGDSLVEHSTYFGSHLERFTKRFPNGENLEDLRSRIYPLLREINEKYSGKTVVVVSHGAPIKMMEQILTGMSNKEATENWKAGEIYKNAEWLMPDFKILPRDETGLFDIHRPFVDGVKIPCHKCKGEMKRVPEVLDVWFDSGAMPYAQAHYPFDKKQKASFAADYISEGVDQTRGWFYTLLAISTLLGKPSAYKNVVSLGLVLDKNGQKMSKSKGNVVNPWEMIEKYGADSLRWYFYTVNPPGESKKFDEIDLGKVSRQFVSLIYNSFVFYETYADKNAKVSVGGIKSKNILDKWVMSRLNQTITEATKKLEAYEIGEAARLIEIFAGDMSRWYIRRSRRRLQRPEDKKDYAAASATLKLVLGELAKLLAPFMPFFAEGLHRSLGNKTSVHMADWPKASGKSDAKLLLGMEEVRDLATKGLAARASAAIKVRQPLASLTVPAKDSKIKTQKEILEILKEEVNVKQIKFGNVEGLELDTNITPELKAEGLVREFVRLVQDLRQDAKLNPSHRVEISLVGDKGLETILDKQQAEIKRMVGADRIIFKKTEKHTAQIETKLEDKPLWLAIRKL